MTQQVQLSIEELRTIAQARPCIDCKHVSEHTYPYHQCIHIRVAAPDLVKTIDPLACREARATDGACGINGRYFEASGTPGHRPE